MTQEFGAGNWRLDPFKRIQVWVPDGPPEPDAFDEPFIPLPPEPREPVPPKKRGPARSPIEHGTRSGYQKEIARGLEACVPCLEAARIYRKQQRRKATTNHQTKDAA